MFCSQCGTKNADDAKFCQNCGAALAAAPTEVAAPPVQYAGFWRRFVAYLIDQLILAIPNMILALLYGLQVLSMFQYVDGELDCDFSQIGGIIAGAIWLGVLIWIVQFLYYSSFESSRLQATPGKMALGIVVTDLEGRRVSFLRALGRNLGKIISNLILCIGYIMAGLSAKKQALHDMMADCLVVMR